MKRFIFALLGASLVVSSCQEEEQLNLNEERPELSTRTQAVGLPYEYYEPQTSDPGAEMLSGLQDAFDPLHADQSLEPSHAIWLLESGLNSIFQDENSNMEGAELLYDSLSVTFGLDANSEILKGDLKARFTESVDFVDQALAEHPDWQTQLLDVHFVSDENGELSFKLYLVAAIGGGPSLPAYPSGCVSVGSSPYAAMAGNSAGCAGASQTSLNGAYENVKKLVRDAVPYGAQIKWTRFNHNIQSFSTNQGHIGLIMNGDYLLGWNNALFPHHLGPQASTLCVTKAEQEAYANAVKNQLCSYLGLNHSGVRLWNFDAYNTPTGTIWGFSGYLTRSIYCNCQVRSALGL